jgi:polyisoprenoid-binding protein YceI
MSSTSVQIPGYVAGTWAIDPVHSEVSFTVRHMMVSKVRGRFDTFLRGHDRDRRGPPELRRHRLG